MTYLKFQCKIQPWTTRRPGDPQVKEPRSTPQGVFHSYSIQFELIRGSLFDFMDYRVGQNVGCDIRLSP